MELYNLGLISHISMLSTTIRKTMLLLISIIQTLQSICSPVSIQNRMSVNKPCLCDFTWDINLSRNKHQSDNCFSGDRTLISRLLDKQIKPVNSIDPTMWIIVVCQTYHYKFFYWGCNCHWWVILQLVEIVNIIFLAGRYIWNCRLWFNGVWLKYYTGKVATWSRKVL